MLRPLVVLLSFGVALLAGCLGDDTSSNPSSTTDPWCVDSCTSTVDASASRSHESSIARNPTDPDNILIGSSSWIGSGEGSAPAHIDYHVSFDGGSTFTTTAFPGDIAPDHPLAMMGTFADPGVLFLDDGSALFSAMVGRGVQPVPDTLLPAFESFDLAVARSTDGGLTWPDAVIVSDTPGITGIQNAGTMTDQPFMTLAPNGDIFVQWILIEYGPDGSVVGQNVASSISKDDGQTWSEVNMVTDDGTSRGGRAAITEDGDVFITMRDTSGDTNVRPLKLARSLDGGTSWTTHPLDDWTAVAPIQMTNDGNDVLVVFGGADSDELETIKLARSTDDGDSWEITEIAQSEQPGPSIPNVVATEAGTIYITYYQTDADGRPTAMATRILADGSRTDVSLSDTLEPSIYDGVQSMWPTYGDYTGVWSDEVGVITSWVGGVAPDTDLLWSQLQS